MDSDTAFPCCFGGSIRHLCIAASNVVPGTGTGTSATLSKRTSDRIVAFILDRSIICAVVVEIELGRCTSGTGVLVSEGEIEGDRGASVPHDCVGLIAVARIEIGEFSGARGGCSDEMGAMRRPDTSGRAICGTIDCAVLGALDTDNVLVFGLDGKGHAGGCCRLVATIASSSVGACHSNMQQVCAQQHRDLYTRLCVGCSNSKTSPLSKLSSMATLWLWPTTPIEVTIMSIDAQMAEVKRMLYLIMTA